MLKPNPLEHKYSCKLKYKFKNLFFFHIDTKFEISIQINQATFTEAKNTSFFAFVSTCTNTKMLASDLLDQKFANSL